MTAAKDALSDKFDESKHNVCNILLLNLSPYIVLMIILSRPRPTSTPTSKSLKKQSANIKMDGMGGDEKEVCVDLK